MICVCGYSARRLYSVFRSGYTLSNLVRRSKVSNFLNRLDHSDFPDMDWAQAYRFYLDAAQNLINSSYMRDTPKVFWFYPQRDLYKDSSTEISTFSPWDRFYSQRWAGFSGALVLQHQNPDDLVLTEMGYIAGWLYRDDFYKNLFQYNVWAYKKPRVRGASRELVERWRDLSLNLKTYTIRSWEDERIYRHKTYQTSMIESFVENVLVMRGFGFYDEENPPRLTWEQAYGELEPHSGPVPLNHTDHFDIESSQQPYYETGLVYESNQMDQQLGLTQLDLLKRTMNLVSDVERRISASTFHNIEYNKFVLFENDRTGLFARHFNYLQTLFLWQDLFLKKRIGFVRKSLKVLSLLYKFREARSVRIPKLQIKIARSVDILSETWLREAAQIFVCYKKHIRPGYLKRCVTNLLTRDIFRLAVFSQYRSLRSNYSLDSRKWSRSWSIHSALWDARAYTRWVFSIERALLQSNLLTSTSLVSLGLHEEHCYTKDFIYETGDRFFWHFWFPILSLLSSQLGFPHPHHTAETLKFVLTPKTFIVLQTEASVLKPTVSLDNSPALTARSLFFLPKDLRISKSRLFREAPFQYPVLVKELETKVHAQRDFSRSWVWLSAFRDRYLMTSNHERNPFNLLQASITFFKLLSRERCEAVLVNCKRRSSVSLYNQLVLRVKLLNQHPFVIRQITKDTFNTGGFYQFRSLYKTYLHRHQFLTSSVKFLKDSVRGGSFNDLSQKLINTNIHRPWMLDSEICILSEFLESRITLADDPFGWVFVKETQFLSYNDLDLRATKLTMQDASDVSNFTKPHVVPKNLLLSVQNHSVYTQSKSDRVRKLKQDINYFKKYFSVYDAIKRFEKL